MKQYELASYAEKFVRDWLDKNYVNFKTTVSPEKPGIVTFIVDNAGSITLEKLLNSPLHYKGDIND